MINQVATAILDAYNNHEYSRDEGVVYKDDKIVFEGDEETAQTYLENILGTIYAEAAMKAMLKPTPTMLWARSKGYEAMIEAGLNETD